MRPRSSGPSGAAGSGLAVELTPCGVRGNVESNTATPGRAEVLTDADSRVAIDEALERKYRLRYKAIRAASRLRGAASNSVVVKISTVA